jgi:hypothetical protein
MWSGDRKKVDGMKLYGMDSLMCDWRRERAGRPIKTSQCVATVLAKAEEGAKCSTRHAQPKINA